MGRVMRMARSNPEIVNTSWTLLKFSLSTSNVFDGAILVMNMSRPKANTRDVDSNRAGDVMIFWTLAT